MAQSNNAERNIKAKKIKISAIPLASESGRLRQNGGAEKSAEYFFIVFLRLKKEQFNWVVALI